MSDEAQTENNALEVAKAPEKAVVLPTEIENALAKVPDQEARSTLTQSLSLALSRTSFGFGPDAETMKIMAETEVHEETCRLEAYKASLSNRESQNNRDHDYRKKKLNHRTCTSAIILAVVVCGIVAGLVLSARGNSTIGNPVLIASFTLLSTLAGKIIKIGDGD